MSVFKRFNKKMINYIRILFEEIVGMKMEAEFSIGGFYG